MRQRFVPALTLILAIAFAASPLVTSPFSGFDGGQLPVPQDSPPIEPAGYAFAIWGLIYAWLILSAAYGLMRRPDDPAWRAPQLWLCASLAMGVPWLWVANQSAIWATVLIFGMAATAILAVKAAPWFDKWTLQRPIGLYAGWLTAASFVSLGSTATGYGLIAPLPAAILGVLLALGAAAAVQHWLAKSAEYGGAVAWALVAIIVQNGTDDLVVSILAAAGIVVVGAVAIRAFQKHRASLPA